MAFGKFNNKNVDAIPGNGCCFAFRKCSQRFVDSFNELFKAAHRIRSNAGDEIARLFCCRVDDVEQPFVRVEGGMDLRNDQKHGSILCRTDVFEPENPHDFFIGGVPRNIDFRDAEVDFVSGHFAE
jgi:hypothetical protein